MSMTLPDADRRIDQLLAVLDTDIRHLEDSLAVLEQLRKLIVKQDHDELGRLLGSIQSESTQYRSNELKRQTLRNELANLYRCEISEITLSRFENELTGEKKRQVTEKKTKLRTLTTLLKKEHANTQRLLIECARFNRSLLNGIFGMARPQSTTYNAAGSTQRQTDNVFMNMQF
ncbi:MAG: flagellar export chaperone FlgN [Planctomycetota bacterium]|jgi:hypothetical protein